MKNIFSSDRRKFFGLLAGVAALPLTALPEQTATKPQLPAKEHKSASRSFTVSGNIGINTNTHSAVIIVR